MEVRFGWIGWFNEGKSDKVWGWFWKDPRPGQCAPDSGQTVYAFWGRRGASPSFKAHRWGTNTIKRTTDSKAQKGYVRIDEERLLDIWPDFLDTLEHRLTWCTLTDAIK